MRRAIVLSLVAIALTIQSAIIALACGDKLLLLGRSIRYQSRHTPRAAAVLVYLPPSTRTLVDPKLESALTEAGHRVRSVTTTETLQEALRGGEFDVVLADIDDAAKLQQALSATQTNSFVLPAVYLVLAGSQQQSKNQAKADAARASKEFGIVLQVPGRVGHYCAAIDKAMELKLKRDRVNRPRG
jgi:CheY-like chemotaxis protein